MSDGIGCKCAAWNEYVCSCSDVDWRSALEVELEDENEALRKDAERFQYLQNCDQKIAQAFFWNYSSRKARAKAIDAAMEKENDQ